jgi:hypothetical protein
LNWSSTSRQRRRSIKLRHERKEREAKAAREELARQVAERNRTAGWGNTAGRRVVRATRTGRDLNRIRQIIAVNLSLGLLVVVIGGSGRYWG